MDAPKMTKDIVTTVKETKFIKLYDLQYAEGKHYFDATRRDKDDLTAIKTTEEFKQMLPDAVSCILILKEKDQEPKLVLFYEFRYPTGQFLLSPPAGLLDPEDKLAEIPILSAAKREIEEETGVVIKDTDVLKVVNPLLFSTPGMSDESNGIACAVVSVDDLSMLTQAGAVGSECFNGFRLVTRAEAQKLLQDGRDENGIFYSVFTWIVLSYFVSDLWK